MLGISNRALHCAILSKYAYKDEEIMKLKAEEMGYSSATLLSKRNAQCYLLETDQYIMIAFRGTEVADIRDGIADLKLFKTKSRTKGNVHSGFYDETEDLWIQIKSHINSDEALYKPIYVCGHSLGGAMAQIAASWLPSRIVECYTYGSPRVGNTIWADAQRYRHFRYVNNNDIVPRVPPVWLCYRHSGQLFYLNYYGNLRVRSFWQYLKDIFRGHFRAWSKMQVFDAVKDHNIDLYVKKLTRIAK